MDDSRWTRFWRLVGDVIMAFEPVIAAVGLTAMGLAVAGQVMDMGADTAVLIVLCLTALAVLWSGTYLE